MQTVSVSGCECDRKLYAAERELRDQVKQHPDDVGRAYAHAAFQIARVRSKHFEGCGTCQTAEEAGVAA